MRRFTRTLLLLLTATTLPVAPSFAVAPSSGPDPGDRAFEPTSCQTPVGQASSPQAALRASLSEASSPLAPRSPRSAQSARSPASLYQLQPDRLRDEACFSFVSACNSIERVELFIDGGFFSALHPEPDLGTLCIGTVGLPDGDHQLEARAECHGDEHVEYVGVADFRSDNPGFRLLSIRPDRLRYRGGQRVELAVAATEPGLRLTADFSRLDSTYTPGDESVEDLGLGAYRIRYDIAPPPGNTAAVGEHPIEMTATDGVDSVVRPRAIALGYVGRREVPLTPAPGPSARFVLGEPPPASGSDVRIVSVTPSSPVVGSGSPVRLDVVIDSGAAGVRPTSVLYYEESSGGHYRRAIQLNPDQTTFQIELELPDWAIGTLSSPREPLTVYLVIGDLLCGYSPPFPVDLDALAGPPPPRRVRGHLAYQSPDHEYVQSPTCATDINGSPALSAGIYTPKPIRHALMYIFDDTTGLLLGDGTSDESGYFELEFGAGSGGDVRLELWSETVFSEFGHFMTLMDGQADTTRIELDTWLPAASPDHIVDHTFADSHVESARWYLFDLGVTGFQWLDENSPQSFTTINIVFEPDDTSHIRCADICGGTGSPGRVGAYADPDSRCVNGTNFPGNRIFLPSYPGATNVCGTSDDLSKDHDDWSTWTFYHEFFHVAIFEIMEVDSPLSRCNGHFGGRPDQGWCEGVATALTNAILGDPIKVACNPNLPSLSGSCSLENTDVNVKPEGSCGSTTWKHPTFGNPDNPGSPLNTFEACCAPHSDGWVWRFLWDFFDPDSATTPEPFAAEYAAEFPLPFLPDFDDVDAHCPGAFLDTIANFLLISDFASIPDEGFPFDDLKDFLNTWDVRGHDSALGDGEDIETIMGSPYFGIVKCPLEVIMAPECTPDGFDPSTW